MMSTSPVQDSLEAMLVNPKARNFLNHLVRAYFPVSNVDKVWEKPKGPFICVLSKDKLVSVEELLIAINSDEFNFKASLKGMFDDKVDKSNPVIKTIGEKKLGITGKETTTFMSYTAYQEFYDWIITKSLMNDKHINWLLRSIRKSSFMERAETINDPAVEHSVEKLKKKEAPVSSSFKLGDMDVFKKIKENFKDED